MSPSMSVIYYMQSFGHSHVGLLKPWKAKVPYFFVSPSKRASERAFLRRYDLAIIGCGIWFERCMGNKG